MQYMKIHSIPFSFLNRFSSFSFHCRPWTMNEPNDEASKDPGIEQTTQGYTEKDFEGKKRKLYIFFFCSTIPILFRHIDS